MNIETPSVTVYEIKSQCTRFTTLEGFGFLIEILGMYIYNLSSLKRYPHSYLYLAMLLLVYPFDEFGWWRQLYQVSNKDD